MPKTGCFYQTKLTADEQYKFTYQEYCGQVIVDVSEYTECYDEIGMHYNYLPMSGCGISQKSPKVVLRKIDSMHLPMSIKRELRQFVEDCIRYGRDMHETA